MKPSSTSRLLGAVAALLIAGSAAQAQPYLTLPGPPAVPPAIPWIWIPSEHIFETFPVGAPISPSPNILMQLRDNGGALYGVAQMGVSSAPGMYSAIATSYVSPLQPGGRRSDVVYSASDAEDLIIANLSGNIDQDPAKHYAIRFSTTPPNTPFPPYPADVERMTILNTGRIGINQPVPVNQFDVGGNAVIGSGYAGTALAPIDGLLVQGDVGIGTTATGGYKLYVNGNSYFNGTGTWSGGAIWSDARFKTNVQPIQGALAKVMKLSGVGFDYRQADFKDRNFPAGHQIGFIAQDLEKVIPEVVTTNADGYKAVAYQNITALLAEAIKEQQNSIASVDNRTASLKADNAKLASDNQALRAQLDDQAARIARLEMALQKLAEPAQAKQSLGSSSSSAKEAQLFQNDPNPFSESTSIRYYLPASVAHAELLVYSAASGKQMLQMPITASGSGSVVVNARDLGSGTYYYTMVADGITVHGKSMIVVK